MDDSELLLRATAYHEAGHAVVGHYFGKWVRECGLWVGLDGDIPGHIAEMGHTGATHLTWYKVLGTGYEVQGLGVLPKVQR